MEKIFLKLSMLTKKELLTQIMMSKELTQWVKMVLEMKLNKENSVSVKLQEILDQYTRLNFQKRKKLKLLKHKPMKNMKQNQLRIPTMMKQQHLLNKEHPN